MGIPKHSRSPPAIHGPLSRIGVRLLTLRRELLFAEEAVAAGNLEGRDITLADLDSRDGRPDLVDDAAEFMAQDVAFGELDDGAVQEMQVGAADGAAGDFEDDVAVFDDLGFGCVDCK